MKTAHAIRKKFSIFEKEFNGKPLIYLDNGATTQKPDVVIDKMEQFYRYENATVHRGVYTLSQQATKYCDDVRKKLKDFISAHHDHEIIFVKGTTEAINLVSQSVARSILKPGQEIVISEMEHHANIVPWQQICSSFGLVLKIVPFSDDGALQLDHYKDLLSDRTGFVSMVHISNTLGTINPIKDIIDRAHSVGALVLIDGAQSIAHMPINVSELDCDFYCFSAHKMYGPTGVGVLYGKEEWLNKMEPYQCGGDMIDKVTLDHTSFAPLPYKFEAGTPAIAQIIGLGAAVDFISSIGWDEICQHEHELGQYLEDVLDSISGVTRIGTVKPRSGICAFIVDGCHAYDIGTLLDQQNICIRVGHHCTQPIMDHFGIDSSLRASIGIYNTTEDVDAFKVGLIKSQNMLK